MTRIIITGASSGIGYALAEAFASRGVMTGVASRNTEPLQKLKDRYPDFVDYERIDVNDTSAVVALNSLADRIGGMDVYLHVAGIGYDNPGRDPERDVQIVQTNCCGFVRLISAAYARMRRDGTRGRIAAITSVAGTKGIGTMAAYSASKRMDSTYLSAMRQLARIDRSGVTFTDIRPGWIETPLLKSDGRYPLLMQLGDVVPQIIKAVVRRRRVAVVDCRWAALATLWRMVPDALWELIDKDFS